MIGRRRDKLSIEVRTVSGSDFVLPPSQHDIFIRLSQACFFALNSLKKVYMIKMENAIWCIGLHGCAGLIKFKE